MKRERRYTGCKKGIGMNKIRDLLEQAARTDTLPAEFSACSPVFLAVLGCLARVAATHPVITELAVSSEGWLLAKHEGDLGFNHALGLPRAGLLTNLTGLCDALGMNEAERKELFDAVPAEK